jgi:protein-S-isoprenylcysteine O-methyltransferase Ste14
MAVTQRSTTRTPRSPRAVVALGYGLASYAGFTAIFLYAVGFLADAVVPRSVDARGPHPSSSALVVDALLLAMFGLPHSAMARPGFKRRWTAIVPRHVERSTYVLVSTLALALVFRLWRPVPTVVWDVHPPTARTLLWGLYLSGWVWVLLMSFAIDHLHLFGLRQVLRHHRGMAEATPGFRLPLVYRLVRHPMMLGFVVAFVATPTMTIGHLLFAVLGCGYILVGVRLEERDLAAELPEYVAYAKVTPRFVPRLRA